MRFTIAILALLIGVNATGFADTITTCTTEPSGAIHCTSSGQYGD